MSKNSSTNFISNRNMFRDIRVRDLIFSRIDMKDLHKVSIESNMIKILTMQWYYVQCEELNSSLTLSLRQDDSRVVVLEVSQAFKRHFMTRFFFSICASVDEHLNICTSIEYFSFVTFFFLYRLFLNECRVLNFWAIFIAINKNKKNISICSFLNLLKHLQIFAYAQDIETIARVCAFISFLTSLNDTCWHLKYLSLKFSDVIFNIFVFLKYRDTFLLINIFWDSIRRWRKRDVRLDFVWVLVMKVNNEIERMFCVYSILSFKFLDIVLDELDTILKTFFQTRSRVILSIVYAWVNDFLHESFDVLVYFYSRRKLFYLIL